MTVLQRFGDLPAVPWRNGGGVTREVFVLPTALPGTDFLARVSIADVDAGGPFSAYPGIDRIIMLLQGGEMRLRISKAPGIDNDVTLRAGEPFAFDGGAPVDCEIDCPTRDLNVMTLRGSTTASMTALQGDAQSRVGGDGAIVVVIGLGDGAQAGLHQLELLDSVVSHDALDVSGPAAVIVIHP